MKFNRERIPGYRKLNTFLAVTMLALLLHGDVSTSAQNVQEEMRRTRPPDIVSVEEHRPQIDLNEIISNLRASIQAKAQLRQGSQTSSAETPIKEDLTTPEQESIQYPSIAIINSQLTTVSNREITPLTITTDEAETPLAGTIDNWVTQSPSGRYIAYTRPSGEEDSRTTFIFDQQSGSEQQISETGNGAWGFDFSNNETQLVFTTMDEDGKHNIIIIDLQNTDAKENISEEANIYDPHFTPDGKGIIYIQGAEGISQNMGGIHGQLLGTLVYRDLESGELTTLVEEPGVGWSVNTWAGDDEQIFVSFSSYRNDPEHNVNVVNAHIGQLTYLENGTPLFEETTNPIPEGSDGNYTIGGQLLIVASEHYENFRPYLVNPTSGQKVPITHNGENLIGVIFPTVSLDEEFITVTRQDDSEVLIIPVSETNISEILNN
jgi:hypothetical protein